MSSTNPFTTSTLTERLATGALRLAPRRAWLVLAGVLAVCSALAAIGLLTSYVRARAPHAPPPIIIVATAQPAPAGVAPTFAVVPVPALYDYRDSATAITIDSSRIACVVGTAEAGAWLLVALDRCVHSDGNVWIVASLLPGGVGLTASAADLTPRTAVPAAEAPGPRTLSSPPIEAAPEPVATELPPIIDLSAAREYSGWHPPLIAPGDGCGGPDVAPPACHGGDQDQAERDEEIRTLRSVDGPGSNEVAP